MKRQTIFTLMMQLLFASILFFSCSKSKDTLSDNPDSSVRTAGSIPGNTNYTVKISIERNAFTPAEVTVMQSGSLLWVNNDNQVHTVTAEDGTFDSGDIQPGGSFSFTFTVIGPHAYNCKYHNEATGLVKCVTK